MFIMGSASLVLDDHDPVLAKRAKKTPAEIFKSIKSKDKSKKRKHENSERVTVSDTADIIYAKEPCVQSEASLQNSGLKAHSLPSIPTFHRPKGVSISSILQPQQKTERIKTEKLVYTPRLNLLLAENNQTVLKKPKVNIHALTLRPPTEELKLKLHQLTLKLPKEKLQQCIENSNSNSNRSRIEKETPKPKINALSLLHGGRFDLKSTKLKSKVFDVTLKVDPNKLKKIVSQNIELESIPSLISAPIPRKKEMMMGVVGSFFNEVKARANQKKANPTNGTMTAMPNRTLKNPIMELPVLKRDQFLIYDKSDDLMYELLDQSSLLDNLTKKVTHYTQAEDELLYDMELHDLLMARYKSLNPPIATTKFEHSYLVDTTINEIAQCKYDNLKDTRFSRFLKAHYKDDTRSQWCDLVRPTRHDQILQSQHVRNDVYEWITSAFNKLKRVDRTKRADMLKTKRRTKQVDEFEGFLVDEYEATDDTTDEYEEFVPSLIIEGPPGCGKTSALYAVIKEQLNGHIFELNSSQSRAKKDIIFHLKQIGTTKIVKNCDDDNGLILFDDVDLIDEEEDKDFWVSVVELLTCSYRPVVFTTNDLSKIPEHVLNESTVYRFQRPTCKTMIEYLDLVGLNMGFKFDYQTLKDLSKLDLRQALLQLQVTSYNFERLGNSIVDVKKIPSPPTPSIKTFADNLSELTAYSKTNELQYAQSKIPPSYEHVPDLSNLDEKHQAIEFYSSKLVSNGSRQRIRRYYDQQDYLKTHPGSSFERLSLIQFSCEILPFIKSMARVEMIRMQMINNIDEQYNSMYNNGTGEFGLGVDGGIGVKPRRMFDSDPTDYFDDLF